MIGRAGSRGAALHPQPPNSGRRGFALAMALLALLLIGALVGVVLFAATEETRTGSAIADRDSSLLAAESALELTIAGIADSPAAAVGIAGTESRKLDGLGVPVVVYSTRLDSSLVWLVADAAGGSSPSGVRKRIGLVVSRSAGAGHSITIDRISDRAWSELF
jgi:Tfp pilus assembly protein PilX